MNGCMTMEVQVEFLVVLPSNEDGNQPPAHIAAVVFRLNAEPDYRGRIPHDVSIRAGDMRAIDHELMKLSHLDEVVVETRRFDQGSDIANALVNVRDRVRQMTFGSTFVDGG